MPAMSYEEPQYKIVKKTDIYEVRRYAQRTVAQAKYDVRTVVSEFYLTIYPEKMKARPMSQ